MLGDQHQHLKASLSLVLCYSVHPPPPLLLLLLSPYFLIPKIPFYYLYLTKCLISCSGLPAGESVIHICCFWGKIREGTWPDTDSAEGRFASVLKKMKWTEVHSAQLQFTVFLLCTTICLQSWSMKSAVLIIFSSRSCNDQLTRVKPFFRAAFRVIINSCIYLFYLFLILKACHSHVSTVADDKLLLPPGLGDFEHGRPHWEDGGRPLEGGDCRHRRLCYRRLWCCQVFLYRRRRGQGQ